VDFTQNTTVEVIVEDVNNNAPYFLRNYSQIIPENIQPGILCNSVTTHTVGFLQNFW